MGSKEAERARLIVELKRQPGIARGWSADRMIEEFKLDLSPSSVREIVRQIRETHRQTYKGGIMAGAPVEVGNQIVLERISRIITKTWAHLGDQEKLGSEYALELIYREIKRYDADLIKRNEKRAAPKLK